MSKTVKTMTVEKLLKELILLCREDSDYMKYKVYTGSDPEGNSFGALTKDWLIQLGKMDKVVLLMPTEMLLDSEVTPKEFKHEMGETVDEG